MSVAAEPQPKLLEQEAQDAAAVQVALELPEEVRPIRIAWGYAGSILTIHLLSLLIFWPWAFSWTGLALLIIGIEVYGTSITLGYHRLLTHQGLVCPKWLERPLVTIGVCCLQDTPARWVAIHRMHHKHSDERPDPHSPLVNFFWSHVGWVLIKHREHSSVLFFEQYARDILRDPYYLWLERGVNWFWVYVVHAFVYYAVGFLGGWLWSGHWQGGLQLGASVLIWGVFARTVAVWHITWSVNSVSHIWGYQNYETGDDSRNHWLVAILASGEGWHNNHHADQRAAAHGHKWWELDLTYWVVCILERLGLAKNVVRPRVWREKQEQ